MTTHNLMPPVRLVAPGGPVTAAIRAMRADEPATDYTRLLTLRRAIEDRIEADIALLDAIDGDPDIEDTFDTEPSLCGVGAHVFRGNLPACDDDREDGDDNGIADSGGLMEQERRHLARLAALKASEAADRRASRLRLFSGGAA
ncbi:UNVERIFIED_CONTAM: hypothetical protein Q9R58_28095 [Methylobacteriaceae bacterium AG10]|nr:hypothetical protein [Methylobacteriaceae bacterium AG10]